MKFWRRQPKPRGRRNPNRWTRKLAAVLSDADTYVFGGLLLISIAVGLLAGLPLGAEYGLGAGILTAGAGLFGLGIWLLPPRVRSE